MLYKKKTQLSFAKRNQQMKQSSLQIVRRSLLPTVWREKIKPTILPSIVMTTFDTKYMSGQCYNVSILRTDDVNSCRSGAAPLGMI